MTYRGHVLNGVVVLDDQVALPDGAIVSVELLSTSESQRPDGDNQSLVDRLHDFVGKIEDLPADFAEQHDHYIHGAPRR